MSGAQANAQSDPEGDPAADLAALERFVLENDDLLELEERIGRFNIFDALGIARRELQHSNFLAWLLDPAESHGQGDLFLKAVLMDMLRAAREQGIEPPVSPIFLDGADLAEIDIRREWRNIDLLVACANPPLVVVVENKMHRRERGDKLRRYMDAASKEFGDRPRLHVFLSPDAAEASEPDWAVYQYADLFRTLTRTHRASRGAIGTEVEVFFRHYTGLIGSRFMNDPQIDELCRRIYTNHRRAIELVLERAASPDSGAALELESRLRKEPDVWHVYNRTGKRLDFVPAEWLGWIPPIGDSPRMDPRFWIRWFFVRGKRDYNLALQIGPAKNRDLRRRLIERLTAEPDEFGLRVHGALTEKWTRLNRIKVLPIDPEGDEPDVDAVMDAAMKKLAQVSKLTPLITAACAEIARDH